MMSPVDEPVSNRNACPNLSRPSPTAIMRLLSPSHSRSFLHRQRSTTSDEMEIRGLETNIHTTSDDLVFPLQSLILSNGIPYPH